MPQFSDLSQKEMSDIAKWIHFARMEGHYGELMRADTSRGDASAGAQFFEKNCRSCHARSELLTRLKSLKSADQKALVLKPVFLETAMSYKASPEALAKLESDRTRHMRLLENFELKDVADLLEYLTSGK